MWVFQPSPIKTFAVSHRRIPQHIQHESFLSIDLTPYSFAAQTVDLAIRDMKRDKIKLKLELFRKRVRKKSAVATEKVTNRFGKSN